MTLEEVVKTREAKNMNSRKARLALMSVQKPLIRRSIMVALAEVR